MSIEFILITVVILGVAVYLLIPRQSKSASEPIQLFEAQGGGVCQNPDWHEWAILASLQFVSDGGLDEAEKNAISHFFNSEYNGQTTRKEFEAIKRGSSADQNCRDHYTRFGGNYPAHVTPC